MTFNIEVEFPDAWPRHLVLDEDSGNPVRFATLAEAQAQADEWNRLDTNGRRYFVVPGRFEH